MSERSSVENRTVHAIRIQLHTMSDRSIIIRPKDTSKLCVQLMNPRRTWMTARSGDAVIMKHNGTQSREHIESVELYRVFPTDFNGQTVESARAWIGQGDSAVRTNRWTRTNTSSSTKQLYAGGSGRTLFRQWLHVPHLSQAHLHAIWINYCGSLPGDHVFCDWFR